MVKDGGRHAPQVAQGVKNPPTNAGYMALIPVLGRSPGGGHGNPLQNSCLENSVDSGLQSMALQRSDMNEHSMAYRSVT